jgi:hypothetical protein
MAGYGYALGEDAVHAFTRLPVRQRERLLRILDRLAKHPATTGDYQETGGSGRTYEVRLFDELLLTWWVDHAVREIRVVRLELID